MHDVAIILGSGISDKGRIPGFVQARIRKAINLVNQKRLNHVIFSGKWSYKLKYTPPLTEAEAMKNYAVSLRLDRNLITLEKKSITTVSNFCYVKKIVKENSWKEIVLISNKPFARRSFYIMKKVFGSEFKCSLLSVDTIFSENKLRELERKEAIRFKNAVRFYRGIKEGSDDLILKLATKDLKNNYL